jgi:hypothetical protein
VRPCGRRSRTAAACRAFRPRASAAAPINAATIGSSAPICAFAQYDLAPFGTPTARYNLSRDHPQTVLARLAVRTGRLTTGLVGGNLLNVDMRNGVGSTRTRCCCRTRREFISTPVRRRAAERPARRHEGHKGGLPR